MEEITFKNWSVLSTHWVAIEIYKMKKKNGDQESDVYNPTITISVDDYTKEIGEVPDISEQKVISISSDRFFTESRVAAIFAFQYVKELFLNLSEKVFVYNENQELIEEFDLKDFIDEEV